MHEFSIAEALVQQVNRLAPPNATVLCVRMEAGPMQGIDASAMQWAWQAATQDTDLDGATLELQQPPWRLHCDDCDTEYAGPTIDTPCRCGNVRCTPIGGDELRLVSLDVEDTPVTTTTAPGV